MLIFHTFWLFLQIEADPDPAYRLAADPVPDPAYHFDADPDPTFLSCGSGSTTLPGIIKFF